MQNLADKAMEVVISKRNASFENINDYQREQLSAKVIKELKYKSEVLEDVLVGEELYINLIEALEEKDFSDKQVLIKEIGEMIYKAAIEGCKKEIDDSLNNAASQLALNKQFPQCDITELVKNHQIEQARELMLLKLTRYY